MKNRVSQFVKILAVSSLVFSVNAKATDLFGYFEFDYSQKTKDGQTNSTTKSGEFDTAFVSIMMQHEVDIYKFFSEIELQHGAEFGDNAGTATSSPGAVVVVERAYAEMHFHPMFNVAIGKSLSPTLWKANHYPNIVKPAAEPMMVQKSVIAGGYVGPMIYGHLGSGFSYNIWTDRSPNNSTVKPNNNAFSRFARLGYETKFDAGSVAVSYLAGTVEDELLLAPVKRSPTSVDVNLTYGKFLLWVESATSDGSNGSQGAYAVASYSFDVNGSQELSPYLVYDQYKESAATAAFANYGVGVNYKPMPNLVHKLQVYQQKNDPTLSADGFANGDQVLKYQMVYFYN